MASQVSRVVESHTSHAPPSLWFLMAVVDRLNFPSHHQHARAPRFKSPLSLQRRTTAFAYFMLHGENPESCCAYFRECLQ